MPYASIILEEFPPESQAAMLKFAEALENSLKADLAVRRSDIDALRTDVQNLAAAQQRTEQRLDRVEDALVRLAEAQQRTEERVDALAAAQLRTEERLDALTERVDALAAAQLRTEERLDALAAAQQRTEERLDALTERVDALTERVDALAAAQLRTEERLDALAAAQQRTEERLDALTERVDDLAAAQYRTERELHSLIGAVEKLTDGLDDTRRQLGGLAMTVGYQLEDLAYRALPALLQRDYNLTVEGRLKRGYVYDAKGRALEVNILGAARKNGDTVTIIGEGKAQLSKNDVDRFIRRKLEPLTEVYDAVFPVLVTYMISEPDVEAYAREKDIALYYTYDF